MRRPCGRVEAGKLALQAFEIGNLASDGIGRIVGQAVGGLRWRTQPLSALEDADERLGMRIVARP